MKHSVTILAFVARNSIQPSDCATFAFFKLHSAKPGGLRVPKGYTTTSGLVSSIACLYEYQAVLRPCPTQFAYESVKKVTLLLAAAG